MDETRRLPTNNVCVIQLCDSQLTGINWSTILVVITDIIHIIYENSDIHV